MPRRRELLASASALVATVAVAARAQTWSPGMPLPTKGIDPPVPIRPGGWQFFSPEEAACVAAIADRLIPPDSLSIGGKEAGCALFIDRQLAGPYGSSAFRYMRPPFAAGTAQQGPQEPRSLAELYRTGLAGLDAFCRAAFASRSFAELAAPQQDDVLRRLEAGELTLGNVRDQDFFLQLLSNVREGYFADPIYGGNKGMAGWMLIGFPGARYDYRAEVNRPGAVLDLPFVGLLGRPAWQPS